MEQYFFNHRLKISDKNVYDADTNEWLGHYFVDDYGKKHVLGPHNKGYITDYPKEPTTI